MNGHTRTSQFFPGEDCFFQLNNAIHVNVESFHGNMSMAEAFYFGKGKPPEASKEDEIFQSVLLLFFFISTVSFKNVVFIFYFSIIFFKIFEVFLSGNAKVNVKYPYGHKWWVFSIFIYFVKISWCSFSIR